jgi:DNA-binding NarL/FixJ family response regulator
MSSEIRIVVADDHPLFREGLRAVVDSASDVTVVGEAESGAAAAELALELKPDVVVMDLQMPGVNGIEAARRICEQSPSVAVLMLTMFEDDDSVFAAMRAGARGYVLKGSDTEETLRAIRAVASGDAIFGPAVAQRLVGFFASLERAPRSVFPELSDREREVLDLLARGDSNARIAQRLVISQKTVRNHVSNIFTKLRVADRAQAIVRARDAGIGLGPDPSR